MITIIIQEIHYMNRVAYESIGNTILTCLHRDELEFSSNNGIDRKIIITQTLVVTVKIGIKKHVRLT